MTWLELSCVVVVFLTPLLLAAHHWMRKRPRGFTSSELVCKSLEAASVDNKWIVNATYVTPEMLRKEMIDALETMSPTGEDRMDANQRFWLLQSLIGLAAVVFLCAAMVGGCAADGYFKSKAVKNGADYKITHTGHLRIDKPE